MTPAADGAAAGSAAAAAALAHVEGAAARWSAAAALADIRVDLADVDGVVVTGMGPAGLVGEAVAALAAQRLRCPVLVHRGFDLPRWVTSRTLVVVVCWSGMTEETRTGLEEAVARRARMLVVTSGHALIARAAGAGAAVVALAEEEELPARHAFGALLVPCLVGLGLDDGLEEAIEVLHEVTAAAGGAVEHGGNPARQLGLRLAADVTPLAWGATRITAVAARRLADQLQETAKLPAFHAELPELSHNQLAAWSGPSPLSGRVGLVSFRDPEGEDPRVVRRLERTEELARTQLAWLVEVAARGSSPLARLASMVQLGDLASVYAALERGVDPLATPLLEPEGQTS